MKFHFILIFVLCSIYMKAQTYVGSIGEYPIFLDIQMDYDDNRVTAFYFYKSRMQNISLTGSYEDSVLVLFEKYSDENDQKELFTLQMSKDRLSGTWNNYDVKLNVDLIKTTKNLDKYKTEGLIFIRDSITTYDTKELVWVTEKHSKKTLFRLGNGFTKLEREFMNLKLDSIHTEYAIIGLDCGWADIAIEMDLVSNQYISFTEYSSIFCGGAHPSHNTIGYNFDLKKRVLLNRLIDVYPKLDYYQLLKEKYKNDEDLESECEYFIDDEELWQYISWVFTKNGLTITPSYPHAMTPCEIGFELTYKELKASNYE